MIMKYPDNSFRFTPVSEPDRFVSFIPWGDHDYIVSTDPADSATVLW